MRVVKRSSCISTGIPLAEPRATVAGERARLARLLGVLAAQRERQPDHHPLHLALGAPAARAPRARAGSRARTTASIGVTIVPVGSLSAQPQRALP